MEVCIAASRVELVNAMYGNQSSDDECFNAINHDLIFMGVITASTAFLYSQVERNAGR